MKTNCPLCNRSNDYDPKNAGSMVTCPRCANLFVLKNSKPVPLACPECSVSIPPDARICTNCGFSFDTGKKVEQKIPVYGDDHPAWKKALDATADFIPGLFKIHILLLFFASIAMAVFLNYFGLILLALGAMVTCILLAVCSLFVYAHGVGFLMTGEIQMLQSAMAELTGFRWTFFLFLVFAPPISIFLIIIKIGMLLAKQ
ncbi:MAG: zinc ribbon domain-containing protein [Victivallales bacterium]|nr:zinc ribbon domain-containing protein [Victivallales bacterium]